MQPLPTEAWADLPSAALEAPAFCWVPGLVALALGPVFKLLSELGRHRLATCSARPSPLTGDATLTVKSSPLPGSVEVCLGSCAGHSSKEPLPTVRPRPGVSCCGYVCGWGWVGVGALGENGERPVRKGPYLPLRISETGESPQGPAAGGCLAVIQLASLGPDPSPYPARLTSVARPTWAGRSPHPAVLCWQGGLRRTHSSSSVRTSGHLSGR